MTTLWSATLTLFGVGIPLARMTWQSWLGQGSTPPMGIWSWLPLVLVVAVETERSPFRLHSGIASRLALATVTLAGMVVLVWFLHWELPRLAAMAAYARTAATFGVRS